MDTKRIGHTVTETREIWPRSETLKLGSAPEPSNESPLTPSAHIPSNIDGLARSSPKWNRGNALSEMVSATVKS